MSENSEFKVTTYRRDITKTEPDKFQLKDVFGFLKYVFHNRVDIWKSMKKKQKEEEHVLAVARYLTEQNEITLRNKNRTLAEEDEKFMAYKLAGTIDRNVLQQAAGVGLDAIEKGKGERIKLN